MQNYTFISKLTERHPDMVHLKPALVQSVAMLAECARSGGKIFTCGNGGSAADAEHIVGELMKGFLLPRRLRPEQAAAFESTAPGSGMQLAANLQQAIPAVSLVSSVSLATAFANDVSAEYIFAQQVFGLAKEGDVLWGLSTSGNAPNVLHAFRVARAFKIKTLGFTGRDGGKMAALCDVEIRAPHTETPAIQEMHLPLYHAVCADLEALLFSTAIVQAEDL
ncbi:MAG: SIS domain-containing protein [Desulfobulbus sp.]|jgi:D-sedoheptulose 7-phosphate isomerase|uniref:D-sedoheptulose-7-phosphate isomerase n=1 Tax=Desulfobulbus sp. TaxID=895 RepID=UPI0028468D7E|nr:SIS domain-containing protein [Desulfobulbus sp.]MDR2548600.1 SIS domain-containing protein [Desulfobulbus sp.]